ncbi:DUF3732 domain-containing protein [Streptomyces sp. bgisy126]
MPSALPERATFRPRPRPVEGRAAPASRLPTGGQRRARAGPRAVPSSPLVRAGPRLLSLHEWFSEHRGPVPRTLILDQPSQVYFPPDYTGEPTPQGTDLSHLLNIYRIINDTVQALDGALQVIVVEHADLADPLFRDHVVERWRYSNSQALVPPEWITEPIDDEDV